MLDIVKAETERIESRFLEPSCGNGNFIAEALRRKLAVVAARYRKSPGEYQRYAFLAASSIYGVDIQADNVEECQARLYQIVADAARVAIKGAVDEKFLDAVRWRRTSSAATPLPSRTSPANPSALPSGRL